MPSNLQRALSIEAVGDISSLEEINDKKVTDILHSKFLNYNVYTDIGACNIVAVNPFKQLAQNDAQTSEDYVTSYKATFPKKQIHNKLNSHIFELVNRAYLHMRRTGNDQVLFLCGESGSGKSELHNLALKHLMRLSASKRNSKVQAQILNGQKILRAFSTAKTSYNEKGASRCGLYTETHFNERGKLVGGKTLHYFLEKTRVTSGRQNEGNFNVFYWLLAGSEPDEKQVLQIKDDPKAYNYLAKYGRSVTQIDLEEYKDFKAVMRGAGFRREHYSRIIQLLAAILHLGNISFIDPASGVGAEEATAIQNPETLELTADLLGLDPRALETVLTFKTTMIGKDVTTLILNSEQAAAHRDELAQTLYTLLFSWMVEYINSKTYSDTFNSFIGMLDFPGTQPSGFGTVGFEQYCVDYANERIHSFITHRMFEADNAEFISELIQVPEITYNSNTACVALLERPTRGINAIFNKMSSKTISGKRVFTDNNAVDAVMKYNQENPALTSKISNTGAQHFAIRHYAGEVTYDPTGFINSNNNQLLVDFISLFRGNADMPASWNNFVLNLFSEDNLAIESHPISAAEALVAAQQSVKPTRAPSMRKSKRNAASNTVTEKSGTPNEDRGIATVLAQIQSALDELINSFQEAALWTVYCIRPNATGSTTQFDSLVVQSQIRNFNLDSLAKKMKYFYMMSLPHQSFLTRYAVPLTNVGLVHDGTAQEQCESVKHLNDWSDSDMNIGSTKVFLSFQSWRFLEEKLRVLEKEEQKNLKIMNNNIELPAILTSEDGMDMQKRDVPDANDDQPLGSIANTDPHLLTAPPPHEFISAGESYISEDDEHMPQRFSQMSYANSQYGSSQFDGNESYLNQNNFRTDDSFTAPPVAPPPIDIDATEEKPDSMTPGRKRWLWFVYAMTCWVPSLFLIKCGRMNRKDIRVAWREKLTLCMLITLMCAFVIWFLVFFGEIICPHQDVFSVSELAGHNSDQDGYVAIRGEVFNLAKFAPHHFPNLVPTSVVLDYAGKDATELFPVQVSDLCENVSPYISLDYKRNYTDDNAQYHDFTYASGNYRKNWYYSIMTMLRRNYKVGDMGVEWKGIRDQAKGAYTLNGQKINRQWAVINNCIYDLTAYIMGGRYTKAPPGETVPDNVDTNFLNPAVVRLFEDSAGTDVTEQFNALNLSNDQKYRELVCMRNLYYVGMVDYRNSTQCQFSTYFLLVVTVCLCIVVLFKFLAAIRFGSPRVPEELDKFVICQVTCYTEDEDSLRKTIDSLATLRYDDKRKLIVVICDGMIIGSGNDRPTPRIVLDIFGVDPQVDPEALSFISVGEGVKQHNRAKIYSGLYEIGGHVVPYLVIAKVGAPTERQKPGNRGKRDSQMVLMNFLNRVHYNAPMNPMQLEMYHQMRNVIGVTPELYEYVLMVDADTEVMPDGLNYLVSSMAHDAKIIGLCGETTLANEKDTWVTMIQVYEYFISHHMIKAFESLFSTVSCLPGCFTMYRIRSVDGKRPLFIANEIIDDYKENVVDTLHKKNLLYLGEDRYLTTLLLKHFPNYKTKFNPDAQCKTNAPDTWSVLVSQRRRWINSTVHNLGELVFLPSLCGFCCFSMRFVVILDLISTLVQPALLAYLGFLIYKLVEARNQVPIITIITLGCTYGLQIVLFILKRRWEHIAWFFLSILALPVFSLYIPIYAYWHFDDFSWGNTRIVVGEKGKQVAVGGDDGEFDPKSIPLMTWAQYEKLMLATESNSDGLSQSTYTPGTMSFNGSYSVHNGGGQAYSQYGGFTYNSGYYPVNTGGYSLHGGSVTGSRHSMAGDYF
ncbi:chitin synthase-domain-containing protein [Mycotypha africana]|uniref:chitin synthase-domain-containing protein n=1 Tax=Mycotypha africana TaxID=64632 RepID=UPI0022FFF7C8|nr:chitin synthase-domain-containing protein [Mycotypha africana]KAI8979324.1 chitin synthase-domain-containing protein [Mycotypha africana]